MSYQVPQHINKNKIFIVNRSEIEGRLDPSIYKCAFKFISNIYPNVRLSDVAYINPKVSFNNMRNDDFISFIPMENIDEQNGEVVKYDSLRVQEAKGYVKFIENDLLWAKITPCMQNGKSAIARNLINGIGCGSTEFHIVRPKNKAVLIEYIHFLLHSNKILETAKNYFGGSAGQQRVPSFFLEHFSTPLPPLEVQKDIVKKIKEAKNSKKEKDKEAQQLLDSIDDYLLKELGIVIPKVDTSLQNRMFYSSYKNIMGGRIDPKKYSSEVRNLYESIESSPYNKSTLYSLVSECCSGDWGIEDNGKLHNDYIKCLVLKATEIDKRYNIRINPEKVKYRLIKNDTYKKMSIEEYDIIIEKSGGSKDQPVGRVAIIDHNLLQNGNIAFSNFLLKIKTKYKPLLSILFLKNNV